MSIRKTQITRKAEEIIKSYLFRGRYPTFQTITHHFGQWLREHTPGAPVFSPKKVMKKEKSSSEKYNQHIRAIHQDITDMYDTTIQQTTQIMSDFEYLEVERNKIVHELANISKKIDNLLLTTQNTDKQYYDSYTVSFENAHDVNKEHSTALVNLINKEVSLMENTRQTNTIKINPNQVTFQTLQPSHRHVALESLRYAFDDNINTAWWQVVKTKELGANNEMRAELIILFDQMEDINEIEYIPHHGKSLYTKLEYTVDGLSFMSINQQAETDKITGTSVWSFQQIQAKGIKFIFTKREYDERSNDDYNYYFGAKSINVYKKNYVTDGILYTNPIIFDQKIQNVSIATNDEIPYGSTLDYEIAIYQEDKNLNELIWHPISSIEETKPKHSTVISLNVKERKKVETSKADTAGEIINGMKVFRLIQDNGSGIISEKIVNAQTGVTEETFDEILEPKLFRGINQWRRERTYLPFKGEIPLNSKWDEQYRNRPENIRVDYIGKGNELNLSRQHGGFNDNFYRFTICIYSEEPRNEPLSLSVMSTTSTGSRKRLGAYAVYVNRQRLAPANDEVTMPFIKGWNEIQILYHWGDMQERKDVETKNLPNYTMLGKFNFQQQRKVRADLEHLTYISAHDLYHNVSPNNHNYFAIHERQVVLNYLPENCIFQLSYETSYLTESHNQLILRAKLKRDYTSPHVTPKIYSIQLRVK